MNYMTDHVSLFALVARKLRTKCVANQKVVRTLTVFATFSALPSLTLLPFAS